YVEVADYAVLAAGNAVVLVDLKQAGVSRSPAAHQFDDLIPFGALTLDNAAATVLAEGAAATTLIDLIVNQAAVLTAFEQIDAAETCCTTGRDYAMDRYAFGRPLASYQAIKHKPADFMVKIELARSNAYFGAWAMNEQAPE